MPMVQIYLWVQLLYWIVQHIPTRDTFCLIKVESNNITRWRNRYSSGFSIAYIVRKFKLAQWILHLQWPTVLLANSNLLSFMGLRREIWLLSKRLIIKKLSSLFQHNVIFSICLQPHQYCEILITFLVILICNVYGFVKTLVYANINFIISEIIMDRKSSKIF